MNDLESMAGTRLERMNSEILRVNSGRRIGKIDGARWGELISPAPDESQKDRGGLRVLAICSWTLGLLTFEALKEVHRRYPDRLRIVGLVTDDPVESKARISVRRRFWRYYDEDRQERYEEGIIESALSSGIPVYTGEVKIDGFRKLLSDWDPDAIIVAAFGQLIDSPIIGYPEFGIYNVHPADLSHHHGAGPQPWEDLVARKASITRTAIHRVSEEIDSGHVLGESPQINIKLADGSLSDDVRLIGEKTLMPVSRMVTALAGELMRRKGSGDTGPIVRLEFGRYFDESSRKKLLEPIDPSRKGKMLPLPADEMDMDV